MNLAELTEEGRAEALDNMPLGDLLQLHAFVFADSNRVFGTNTRGKLVVKARLAEVEKALYDRIYGCNPFTSVTVEGQPPETIDLSKFDRSKQDDEEPKTFTTNNQE